jgi:hypothetical protein
MPTEERHITFTDTEVAAAAQRFIHKRDKRMLGVTVRQVKPIAEGRALDGAHVVGNNGIERVNVDLGLAELTAALLNECFSKKVPIPRNAEKQVQFNRDRFELVLHVSSPVPSDLA